MDYQKQAADFLSKNQATLKVVFVKHDRYFSDDKGSRDIWKFTLRRNGKQYSGTFGQALANVGKTPTAYDLLSCLTKYDPETFENFCSEYGYDTDSRKAEKIFKAVTKEFIGVNRVFGDVLEELAEIQ